MQMAEEEDNEKSSFIIDNGSGYCKVGFSGEEGPREILKSCVGYPNYDKVLNIEYEKDFYVGEYAEKIGLLSLIYPIEHGVVTNWENMEKIYNYIFNNHRVDPSEYNVFLTESLMNPKKNKDKMAQIMFETYKIPGLYFAVQPFLCLYSAGKYTGFVVDSGEGLTQFSAIIDGYGLPQSLMKLELSGGDITDCMIKFLNNIGINFPINEKEFACPIKEKACYVAYDFEKELKSVDPFDYELPDGNHIIIENEQRIRCTEELFKPSKFGKKGIGLAKTCFDLIQKCSIDLKKDLYNNIVLNGGNTLFKGFPERFEKEMKLLVPESMKEEIKVWAEPERKYCVYIGGSILATMSSFKSEWITKKEYEENGAKIIR